MNALQKIGISLIIAGIIIVIIGAFIGCKDKPKSPPITETYLGELMYPDTTIFDSGRFYHFRVDFDTVVIFNEFPEKITKTGIIISIENMTGELRGCLLFPGTETIRQCENNVGIYYPFSNHSEL
jgi:hypothetical protein